MNVSLCVLIGIGAGILHGIVIWFCAKFLTKVISNIRQHHGKSSLAPLKIPVATRLLATKAIQAISIVTILLYATGLVQITPCEPQTKTLKTSLVPKLPVLALVGCGCE